MEILTYQSAGLRAAEAFIAAGFDDGDTITRDWLCEQFGLESNKAPGYGPCCRVFKNILLIRYKKGLETLYGRGYRVIPAGERTKHANGRCGKRVLSALVEREKRLIYIETEKLTNAQQKENTDSLAHNAQCIAMFSRDKSLT